MKVFNSLQIKKIDRLTIENEPISSIQLMERASLRFTQWFTNRFDSSHQVVVFAGAGNNGGDALAISRMLVERHYRVRVFLVVTGTSLSVDCVTNLKRLEAYLNPVILDSENNEGLPHLDHREIIIDGIFGSGLNRPVDGHTGTIIRHINHNAGCVVSIDIPSGLFGEDNRLNNPENIIKASFTVSFEFPFFSFFMSENEKYTGLWEVIEIGLHKESIEKLEPFYLSLDTVMIRELIIPRKKYSHKGTYGHALIIAGKYGMMGASVLCAKACLRGGAGLTTVCIPRLGYDIVQSSIPEALVQAGDSDEIFNKVPDLSKFQAIACGPGIELASATGKALHDLLVHACVPLVLDADALNILSEHKDWIELLPRGTVITPHPKEFDRLAGTSPDMYSRHLKQLEFASKYNVLVILKGAHTLISTPDGKSYINTTGNPGMATGGSGDVLTGLLVSLMAQGYSSLNASLIAVFIHGLAADLALESSSMEALIAGDIIEKIGPAFRMVKGKA
jgi:hydroxyethylthiazole kinase-like uncharacterized protein yjeF